MNQSQKEPHLIDQLYDYLFEEDARVCKDIPDSACREVPGNFFKIGVAQTFGKLADEISNAKTVLPWLLSAVDASGFWIGLLVPVRESLSLLPQLLIAAAVRKQPRRKYAWVLSALLQGIALLIFAATALFLHGAMAGIAVILTLAFFSLARGLSSVAFKDVIGKTIPKTRRGRLTGITAAVSGLLTLVVGLTLIPWVKEGAHPSIFAVMFVAASAAWFLCMGFVLKIYETPGETEGGGNAFFEALKSLNILRTDAAFRHFVIVRSLFVSTALAGPYYVVLANESGSGKLLPLFILASGAAASVSSLFWGRYSDRSSKMVLIAASAVASVTGVLLYGIYNLGLLKAGLGWVALAGFFLLAIAHNGVRIGRKTYLLDMAGGTKRTDYVAVSNTVIGLVLLASGLLGVLTPYIHADGMLLLLSVIGLIGAALGLKLPEVED